VLFGYIMFVGGIFGWVDFFTGEARREGQMAPADQEGAYVLAVDKAIDDYVDNFARPVAPKQDTGFPLLAGFVALAILDVLIVLFRRAYIPKLFIFCVFFGVT
jgi:hypothetical protein